jgi:SAM-dependent methyltransferase
MHGGKAVRQAQYDTRELVDTLGYTQGLIRRLFFRAAWWLEKRLLPELRSSQYPYAERVAESLHQDSVWLDLGCGHQVFADWMADEQKRAVSKARYVVGIDLDFAGMLKHPDIDDMVMGRLEALPFPDAQFDLVTANMVVEHIDEAVPVLREIARVLRPNGRFVFHTPNFESPIVSGMAKVPEWPKRFAVRLLQGRKDEDIFQTHYCFNTIGDIEKAAESVGVRITSLDLVNTSAMTVMLSPVAVFFELLYLRTLRSASRARRRTNLVGVLTKPDA